MIPRTKFVGREEELKKLKRKLKLAIKGTGKVVFISGEAGIGKSRLVYELLKVAKKHQIRILIGSCISHTYSDPFLPFIDALRRYFQLNRDDTPKKGIKKISQTIKESSPELVQMIPIIGDIIAAGTSLYVHYKRKNVGEPIPTTDPRREQDKMFETISQLILSIAQNQPTILFIDDLQWADEHSLGLLHYISRKITNSNILIIGSYRPEEMDISNGANRLTDTLRRMNREKLYDEIKLKRLNLGDINQIIISLYKLIPPKSFVQKIFNQTEGNPFFTEETLLFLQEERLINKKDKKWPKELKIAKIQIPSRVEDVIARRLDRLREDEIKMLKFASILDDPFQLNHLQEMLEVEDRALFELIETAITKKLLYELPDTDNKFGFAHALIKTYLKGTISKTGIKILSKKAGLTIESLEKNNVEDYSETLAYYFKVAEIPDKIIKYSTMAGDKTSKLFAYEEAIEHYGNAIKYIEKDQNISKYKNLQLELWDKLGKINYNLGETEKALEFFNNSAQSSMGTVRAEALRNIGITYQRKDEYPSAELFLKQSIDLSNKYEDSKGAALSSYWLGAIYEKKGDFTIAMDYYNLCLKYAQSGNHKLEEGMAYHSFGRVNAQQGSYKDAIVNLKKALIIVKELHDKHETAKICVSIGATLFEMKNYDQALKYHEKGIKIAQGINDIRVLGYGLADAADCYIKLYEKDKQQNLFNKAILYLEKAEKIFLQLDEKHWLGLINLTYGDLYRMKHDWNKSISYLNEGLILFVELKNKYYIEEANYKLGQTYKAIGNDAKAKKFFNQAFTIAKEINSIERIKQIEEEIDKL